MIEAPEGILLTLPVAFFEDRQWTTETFKPYFERLMAKEDIVWNFKLTNLPKHDVAWVYFVFGGFVQYRLNLVEYERNVSKVFNDAPDGHPRSFPACNWVIASGPARPAPFDIPMRGFQGFRYTQKLF